VHEDHYVLVDHDLVVHGVIVVSITSNSQFICRFHKLLVTDNDMMSTNSSCASSLASSFFYHNIKGALFLLFASEKRREENT
jgi:hypothetical protein